MDQVKTILFNDTEYQIIDETALHEGDIPSVLPNPNKLTFTGAVTGEYDGSKEIILNIPAVAGSDGADGISPTVSVEEIEGGHRISITDKDGTETVDVMNGTSGKDGVSATHSWDGTTLTITSASGTSSVDLKGEKGEQGEKGEAGTDGIDGKDGNDGLYILGKDETFENVPEDIGIIIDPEGNADIAEDGATFTPRISSEGVLSWTNDKGLPNPAPVNIMGKDYVLTDDDKALISNMVITQLGGEPIFGCVDENNRIVIKGKLADANYTVLYEMEDGSEVEIGDLVLGKKVLEYTNLVESAIDFDKALMGGKGYIVGNRWSSSNVLKDEPTATAVGLIPMSTYGQALTLYVYGLDFTGTTSDLVIACTEISNGAVSNGGYFSNLLKDGFTGTNYVESVKKLADYYYKITTIAVPSTYKYIAISGKTVDGVAPIVTLNQPIFEVG